MPRFDGEDCQNISALNGVHEFTDEYRQNAVEMVRMNNTHKCATAINGCKKEANDECRRGYNRTDTILETFVNEQTNRIVYRRRKLCDLKIVPYNLHMMMDWDSHINVEYSGSAYCALYLYKYCYKGAARKEQIDLSFKEQLDSLDEIKQFIYGRVMCAMSAVWRLYGYPFGSGIEIEKKGQKWVRNRKFSGIFWNSVRKAQPRNTVGLHIVPFIYTNTVIKAQLGKSELT